MNKWIKISQLLKIEIIRKRINETRESDIKMSFARSDLPSPLFMIREVLSPCSVRTIKSLVSNGSPAGETTRSGLSKLSFWHVFVHAIRRSSTHSDSNSLTHFTHSTHVHYLASPHRQGRGEACTCRYFRQAFSARSTKRHVYRRTVS